MRFGGHQTFSIREGWLFKGMRVLKEEPEVFTSDALQDHLGVGKNMAKSIQHWLVATGMARQIAGSGRARELQSTEFGELVWQCDRYMLHPATWWLVHTHLVFGVRNALTWNWFFNRFTPTRFERSTVVESLRRYLQRTGSRMPAIRTLERDVACMLRSYAEVVPRETSDPEDVLECPLVELGLMSMSRHSGAFRIDRGLKAIPLPVFGYVVSRAYAISEDQSAVDASITDLAHDESGPGRIFALSSESMFELVSRYESEWPDRVSILNQAGERVVRLQNVSQGQWLEEALTSLSPVKEVALHA